MTGIFHEGGNVPNKFCFFVSIDADLNWAVRRARPFYILKSTGRASSGLIQCFCGFFFNLMLWRSLLNDTLCFFSIIDLLNSIFKISTKNIVCNYKTFRMFLAVQKNKKVVYWVPWFGAANWSIEFEIQHFLILVQEGVVKI